MVLPAPPTLSITMVAPSSGLRMASARSRATRSVGPPAAKGTTMVMLFLPGKSWAAAPKARAAAVAASVSLNRVFM
jgi:hypothetical protein